MLKVHNIVDQCNYIDKQGYQRVHRPKAHLRNPEAVFRLNQKTNDDSPFDITLPDHGDDFPVVEMHFKLGLYEHQYAGALEDSRSSSLTLNSQPTLLLTTLRMSRLLLTSLPLESLEAEPSVTKKLDNRLITQWSTSSVSSKEDF